MSDSHDYRSTTNESSRDDQLISSVLSDISDYDGTNLGIGPKRFQGSDYHPYNRGIRNSEDYKSQATWVRSADNSAKR